MTKAQYWEVKLAHVATAYNDNTEYSILDGKGRVIAYDTSFELLYKIVRAHNYCFFEEEAPRD